MQKTSIYMSTLNFNIMLYVYGHTVTLNGRLLFVIYPKIHTIRIFLIQLSFVMVIIIRHRFHHILAEMFTKANKSIRMISGHQNHTKVRQYYSSYDRLVYEMPSELSKCLWHPAVSNVMHNFHSIGTTQADIRNETHLKMGRRETKNVNNVSFRQFIHLKCDTFLLK